MGVPAREEGEPQRKQSLKILCKSFSVCANKLCNAVLLNLDGLVGGKHAPQYMSEERNQEARGARWQESQAQGLPWQGEQNRGITKN